MRKMAIFFVLVVFLGCKSSSEVVKSESAKENVEKIVVIDNDEIKISYSKLKTVYFTPIFVKRNAAEKSLEFIVKKGEISSENYEKLVNNFVQLTDGTNFVSYVIKKNTNMIIGPMVLPYSSNVNIIQMSVYINGKREGLKGVKVDNNGELINE
ncbi:MAG: hypothetical protein N2258_02920 [Brevinematales bacterium]|nr:hypothetical protein [Brevinematales bacterium]